MDLELDSDKAAQFTCPKCDPSLQKLRNCSGTGPKAMIPLNNVIYTECPKAISLKSPEARYLVSTYYHCQRTKSFPFSGGPSEQTEFTMQLFEFIATLIGKHNKEQQEKSHS